MKPLFTLIFLATAFATTSQSFADNQPITFNIKASATPTPFELRNTNKANDHLKFKCVKPTNPTDFCRITITGPFSLLLSIKTPTYYDAIYMVQGDVYDFEPDTTLRLN